MRARELQSGNIVIDTSGLSWLVLDAVVSDGRSTSPGKRGPVNSRVRISWLHPDGFISSSDHDENQRMEFIRPTST